MTQQLWRSLRLTTAIPSAPPLLIQTRFTSDSYSILVTDLTTLWAETLSRADILTRAAETATSIDPSEDADQLARFLDMLAEGLAGAHATTRLALSGDGARLWLKMAHQLPAGLEPLQWRFALQRRPAVEFAALLVLPLVHALGAQERQLATLLDAIAVKDAALQRMREKLEGAGHNVVSVVGRSRRRALAVFDRGD